MALFSFANFNLLLDFRMNVKAIYGHDTDNNVFMRVPFFLSLYPPVLKYSIYNSLPWKIGFLSIGLHSGECCRDFLEMDEVRLF